MAMVMQRPNSTSCSRTSGSRSAFAAYVCVALLLTGSAACKPAAGTARAAAETFLDAHYVRIELQASFDQSVGLAREKVREELELTAEVEAPEATAKPRIHYKQINVREKPGSVSFVYELTISPEGSAPFTREVMLTVRRGDGGWKVSNFTES